MKKILLLFSVLLSLSAFAQNMRIKATLVDTISDMPVRNAVGMLIRVKDSVLLDEMGENAGNFVHNQPNSSEIILKEILE